MNQNENRAVKAVAFITAVCLLGDSMLYVVLPIHWQEAGLASLSEVLILLSINRFIRLPLNPFVTWVYGRLRLQSGVLIAVVIAAVTTASYGLVKEFWLWLIMRSLWGVAWTFLRQGAYFTIIDLSNERRGYHMGMYNGLYRLGSLAGMLAGGLFADLYGLDAVALVFAVITASALPFVFVHVSPARLQVTSTGKASVPIPLSIWRDQSVVWTLTSGLMIAMLFQGMVTATLSHVIETRYSSEPVVWGVSLGAATLAGFLQACRWGWEPWLAPWFGRRSDGERGRRPLFLMTLILAALCFALVPTAIPLWLWLIVILGLQLTATILTTVMDALASDAAARSEKYSAMSAYSFMFDLGAAVGPLLAILVDERTAYWSAAGMLVVLALRWKFACG